MTNLTVVRKYFKTDRKINQEQPLPKVRGDTAIGVFSLREVIDFRLVAKFAEEVLYQRSL